MFDVRDILVMLATLICLLGLARVAGAEEADPFLLAAAQSTAVAASESAPSESDSAATLAASANESAEADKKPWSVGLTAQHYWSHRTDLKSFTDFTLDGRYKLNERQSLQVLLPAVKYYEIPSYGQSEFELDDTSLYHFYTIVPNWNEFKFQVRSALTLPTSKKSRRDGNISKPGVQLRVSRSFLKERLTLSYRPYFTAYINQYKNTVSGTPLTKFSLGHALVGEYKLLDDLAVGMALQGAYNFKHQGQGASNPPAGGSYGFDAYIGYDWTDFLNVSLGYYQGDSFIKDGRYEVLVFDPYTTRFYFSMTLSL